MKSSSHHTSLGLLRIGLIVLMLSRAASADDWPQWLGPKRDGGTTEVIATWSKETAPKEQWRHAVGDGYAMPVVAGGRVYLHTRGPDLKQEEEQVTAYDAATGKVVWSDVYARPKYSSVLGTGPRASPTVAGKRLFTIGINGVLSCYDAEAGKRTWQVDLYDRFQAELPAFAVCCSPLVIGNRVIVSVGGSGRCIVALHADTGEAVWQALDDAASTSSPVLFAAGGRSPGAAPDVVFMTPLRIVALDPIDGTLRWEYPLVFQPQGTSPTPLVFQDRIVASTQAHGAVAVRVTADGEAGPKADSIWQVPEAKSYFSSGIVAGKRLILVTNVVEILPNTSLTCLAGGDGKQLWSKSGVGYFHAGIVRTGDGKLLVLSDNGELSLLEFDDQGEKELCRATVCGGTLVSPAVADGRLFVRDGKELVCWEFAK